jgi:uncharacterized protein involved in tolerance to divalent cations
MVVTTPSAADTVLGTVELLEQILLEASCLNILSSQRSSSFWQSTITRSPNLQIALFLKTDPKAHSTQASIKRATSASWIDLPAPISASSITAKEVSRMSDGASQGLLVNPFLRTVLGRTSQLCYQEDVQKEFFRYRIPSLYTRYPQARELVAQDPMKRKHRLVTQPGVQQATVIMI